MNSVTHLTINEATQLVGTLPPEGVSPQRLVNMDGLLEIAVSAVHEGVDLDNVFTALWQAGYKSEATRLQELEG